jgi:hypothetical protein
MKTFLYIEDYLEVIAGERDPVHGKLYGLFNSTPPIVSLARYDVGIVNSMASSTIEGKSLTDKQAELAIKIVLKYRKQLEKIGIDVGPAEEPKFRLGIRTIDRRRILYVENDHIVLQFPYDTKLIDDIRDLAKISQGAWRFQQEPKVWKLAITETNVVAAHGFAINHQFEIADDFKSYLQSVIDCEAIPYEIKLTKHNGQLSITNAAASLVSAINNYCGFDSSNIDILVDESAVYGYSVDKSIEEDIVERHGPRIYNLMTAKESKFNPNGSTDVFEDLVRYAEITNRYPIYVYEPDLSGRLFNNFVEQYFEQDDVYRATTLKKESDIVEKKVVYFHKFHTSWAQPIPLLVSGQGMMYGGEKSMLLQQAKKIVYFVTEVYNNKKTRQT